MKMVLENVGVGTELNKRFSLGSDVMKVTVLINLVVEDL